MRTGPVSYTHLDVYKRQLYASAPQAFGDESGDGESIDELREDKPELPTPARRGIALCHVAAIHEIPHGHPFSKSSSCTYNLRLSINPIGRGVTHKLHDPSTDSHGFVHLSLIHI